MSTDNETSVPAKKAVRRGRKKTPRPAEKEEAENDTQDDEVNFDGIAVDEIEESSDTPDNEGGDEQDSEDIDRDRRNNNNRNNNNRRGNNNNNKRGNNKNNKRQGGKKPHQNQNQQKQRNNKQRQPNRGHNRETILLADGTHYPVSGLKLGELPQWEDIKYIDDLTGLAAEYAGEDEALDFEAIYSLPLPQLLEEVSAQSIKTEGALGRPQALRAIMDHAALNQRLLKVKGSLELLDNGHGLIVFSTDNYSIKPNATLVPQAFIKEYGLQRGHEIEALAHPPREGESTPYALKICNVNGMTPEELVKLTPFTELVPYYPLERILLETKPDAAWDNISMRIVDLLTPIGLGQRGLIVAPPRTGKTVLMQAMANSIAANRPEVELLILLVDERPEEVTDFRRNCAGEVIASTFDQDAESHSHAAEMVIERARRMVEAGKDVVILLDSITRLARAYNTLMPNSGKILSGGVEANAMQKPKRFFGSARNIEDGGSLTILGTALVETGSRMDEVIFEEFKGTGNMELHLERALVEKRVFPALSFEKSGTRKEELLYHPDEMSKVYSLRRAMKGVPSTEAMEMLIQRVKKTKTNAEFLMAMSR